jgi:hypothetical protein
MDWGEPKLELSGRSRRRLLFNALSIQRRALWVRNIEMNTFVCSIDAQK